MPTCWPDFDARPSAQSRAITGATSFGLISAPVVIVAARTIYARAFDPRG
jgi:hypothetical protein